MSEKVDTESFKELERLRELRVSHRDLDYLIDRLQHDPMVDQLRIRRLKKRKLLLKDMIAALESELIPDLDACHPSRACRSGTRTATPPGSRAQERTYSFCPICFSPRFSASATCLRRSSSRAARSPSISFAQCGQDTPSR